MHEIKLCYYLLLIIPYYPGQSILYSLQKQGGLYEQAFLFLDCFYDCLPGFWVDVRCFHTKKTPAVRADIKNVQNTEESQNTDADTDTDADADADADAENVQNTENVQKKAAVLLPLSGPLSVAGHTVLKGLLTAFYQQKDDLTSVPTTLEFFDSYELQSNKTLKTAC